MRRRHPIVLASSVLCLGLSLTGCGGESHQAGSKATSAPAASAQPTASQKPAKHEGFEVVPLPSLSAAPAPSLPAAPGSHTIATPAPPPAGYQTATAPITRISFAVPASWEVFNDLDTSAHQRISEISGGETSEIAKATALMDVFALSATRDSAGVIEHVFCTVLAIPLDEQSINELIQNGASDRGETVEKTASLPSANGTIYYGVTYSSDTGFYNAVAFLPNPSHAQVSARVSASSAARTEELLGVIASTLR